MSNIENNGNTESIEKPVKYKFLAKKYLITGIIAACSLVAIIAILISVGKHYKYDKAIKLLESENFSEAKELFSKLKDYKDSPDMIKNIDYEMAINGYENGKFHDAKAIFVDLSQENYKDSKEYVKKCDYKEAVGNYEEKKYEDAKKIFSDLSKNKFKDSEEYVKKCDYQMAIVAFNNNDLDKAEKIFDNLKNYEQSSTYIDKILMIEKYQICNVKNEDEINNIESNLSNDYGVWYNLKDGTEYVVDKYNINDRKYGIIEYGGDIHNTAFYYLDDELKKKYYEDHMVFLHNCVIKTISTSDNSEYYEYVNIPTEEYNALYDEYVKEQERLLAESQSKYEITSVYEIAQKDAYTKIGINNADNSMESLSESLGNLLLNVSLRNFRFQDIDSIAYDYDSNNKVHTLLFEVYSSIYEEINNTYFVEAQYKESDAELELIYFYYY